MSIKAKKQHYVWEYYLKSWSDDGQVWCWRNGRIFKTSTENVAQERYFYEINPPSAVEAKLVEKILNHGPAINRAVNLHTFYTYLLAAYAGDDSRRYSIEQHHGMIENKAFPIIEKLAAGDDSPLRIKSDRINLAIFLGQQYTRTKKIKNAFTPLPEGQKIPEEYKECDFQKIRQILAFVYSNNIGNHIFDGLDIKLIRNTSNTRLITSDQPIYNLLATPGKPPKEVEIYYPISPQFALFAQKNQSKRQIASDDEASRLNLFIARNSHEFIFASDEDDLNKIAAILNQNPEDRRAG
jgi:hypothetical protein